MLTTSGGSTPQHEQKQHIQPSSIIKLNKALHQHIRPNTAGHKRPPIQNRVLPVQNHKVDFLIDQQLEALDEETLHQSKAAGTAPSQIMLRSVNSNGNFNQAAQFSRVPYQLQHKSSQNLVSNLSPSQDASSNQQVQQSAADPRFSLTMAGPSQRRPVSAMKPSSTALSQNKYASSSPGLLPLLKPNVVPNKQVAKSRPIRGASAITRLSNLDNRSQSTGSNLQWVTGLSSNGAKSSTKAKGGRGTRKGKTKKPGFAGKNKSNTKSLIQKKASQNFKYVTQQMNNFVANEDEAQSKPSKQQRQRPGSAIVNCEKIDQDAVEVAGGQDQPVLIRQSSSDPLQVQSEGPQLQQLHQSEKGEPQLFYQVYNYYGDQNNHNYNNQQQNSYSNGRPDGSQAVKASPADIATSVLPSQLYECQQQAILAENQPPEVPQQQLIQRTQQLPHDHRISEYAEAQEQMFDVNGVQQRVLRTQESVQPQQCDHTGPGAPSKNLQGRKHQLMQSKVPSSTTGDIQANKQQLIYPQHLQTQATGVTTPILRVPETDKRSKQQTNLQLQQQQFLTNSDSEVRPWNKASRRHNRHHDNNSYFAEPSVGEWNLLNRSYSVDTDHYMRHLQRKCHNFDMLRSLDKQHSLRDLSKLERQMYVMDFMENAPSNNVFRQLKLNGLLEKQQNGPTGASILNYSKKQDLRRMLQQDEDWPSLSGMAHSDGEEMMFDNVVGAVRGRPFTRQNDLGHYLPKNLNQLSQMMNRIKLNDQYKKLQQLKAVYPYPSRQDSRTKSPLSKSKSPQHTRNSLSPSRTNLQTSAGFMQQLLSNKHPLAFQHQRHSTQFIQNKKDTKRSVKPKLIAKKFTETAGAGLEQPVNQKQIKRSKSRKTRHRQALKIAMKKQKMMAEDDVNHSKVYGDNSSCADDDNEANKKRKTVHIQETPTIAPTPSLDQVKSALQAEPESDEPNRVLANTHQLRSTLTPSTIEEHYERAQRDFSSERSIGCSLNADDEGNYADIDNNGRQCNVVEHESPLDPRVSTLRNIDFKASLDLQSQQIQVLKNQIEQLELEKRLQMLQSEERHGFSHPRSDRLQQDRLENAMKQREQQQEKVREFQISPQRVNSDEQSSNKRPNNSTQNDLHTIQSNHQREQMQSSSNGGHQEGAFDADQQADNMTSLLTETELDMESKVQSTVKNGSSVVDNTPKSSQQQATLLQQPHQVVRENGVSLASNMCLSANAAQAARNQPKERDIMLPITPSLQLPTSLDMVREETGSPEQKFESRETRSGKHKRMFDIGEPSEESGNVRAMLDLDIDTSKGLVSSHSSSSIKKQSKKGSVSAAKQSGNKESDKMIKFNSNEGPVQRPPLLKMRTQFEGRSKKMGFLVKGIEGYGNHNPNSSAGGHAGVRSEQQLALEQSSAKMTSNKQTVQAISVVQIPANHNESTQQRQQPIGNAPVHSCSLLEEEAQISQESSSRDNAGQDAAKEKLSQSRHDYLFSLPEDQGDSGEKNAADQKVDDELQEDQQLSRSSPDNNSMFKEDFSEASNKNHEPSEAEEAGASVSVVKETEGSVEKAENKESLVDMFDKLESRIQLGKGKHVLKEEAQEPDGFQKVVEGKMITVQTQTADYPREPSTVAAPQHFSADTKLLEELQQKQIELAKQSLEQHEDMMRRQAQQFQEQFDQLQSQQAQHQLMARDNILVDSNPLNQPMFQSDQGLVVHRQFLSKDGGQASFMYRSEFEQEMLEMLATAAAQPKSCFKYPPTIATPRITQNPQSGSGAEQANPASVTQLETIDTTRRRQFRMLNVRNSKKSSSLIVQQIPDVNQKASSAVSAPQQVSNSRELAYVQRFMSKQEFHIDDASCQVPIEVTLGAVEDELQNIESIVEHEKQSTAKPAALDNSDMFLPENQKRVSSRFQPSQMSSCLSSSRLEKTIIVDDILEAKQQQLMKIGGRSYRVSDLIYRENDEIEGKTDSLTSSSSSYSANDNNSNSTEEIHVESDDSGRMKNRTLKHTAPLATSNLRDLQKDGQGIQPANHATQLADCLDPVPHSPQKLQLNRNASHFADSQPLRKKLSRLGSSDDKKKKDIHLPLKLPLNQVVKQIYGRTHSFGSSSSSQQHYSNPAYNTLKHSTGEITPATAFFGAVTSASFKRLDVDEDDKFFHKLQPVTEQQDEEMAVGTPKNKFNLNLQPKIQPSIMKLQNQVLGPQLTNRSIVDFHKKRMQSSWLVRSSTICMDTIEQGASVDATINAVVEDKKQKIMSKQFDKLFTQQDNDEPEKQDVMFGIVEKGSAGQNESSVEEFVFEYEASYWQLESDEFAFHNMKFSIVKTEHINKIESKILNQVTWNDKLKAKAMQRNFSRMESSLHRAPSMSSRASNAMLLAAVKRQPSRPRVSALKLQWRAGIPSASTPAIAGTARAYPQPRYADTQRDFAMQATSRVRDLAATTLQKLHSVSPATALSGPSAEYQSKIGSSQKVATTTAPEQTETQVACEMYSRLKAEYPIEETKELLQLKKLYKKSACINVSKRMAEQLADLRFETSPAHKMGRMDSNINTSRGSLLTIGSPSKQLSGKTGAAAAFKAANKLNQLLSVSLHCSEMTNQLKQAIMLKANSLESGDQPHSVSGWQISAGDYGKIVEDLERHKNNKFDPLLDFDPPQASGDQSLYLALYENKHLRQSRLFARAKLIVLFEPTPQKFITRKKLQRAYIDYLQQLLCATCFSSYSKRSWNVSQWTKSHYARQGDRALSFFDSSTKRNEEGLRGVVHDSQAHMQVFMRRSTIRQEIYDTLFQRKTELLFDEDYVQRDNRRVLIEKIRQTLEKTCQADSLYQYQLRMEELDELELDRPSQAHLKREKPKAYTQFSRMLIFINFHPPDEKKRWLHQDYMDSLKRRDVDAPAFAKPRQQKPPAAQPMPGVKSLKSQKTMAFQAPDLLRQAPASVCGLNRRRTLKKDSLDALETHVVKRVQPRKAFPFKLNDCFGYWTLVITDGCYQILVPARPPTTAKKPPRIVSCSSDAADKTPEAKRLLLRSRQASEDRDSAYNQGTFSSYYFDHLKAGAAPLSGRATRKSQKLPTGEKTPPTRSRAQDWSLVGLTSEQRAGAVACTTYARELAPAEEEKQSGLAPTSTGPLAQASQLTNIAGGPRNLLPSPYTSPYLKAAKGTRQTESSEAKPSAGSLFGGLMANIRQHSQATGPSNAGDTAAQEMGSGLLPAQLRGSGRQSASQERSFGTNPNLRHSSSMLQAPLARICEQAEAASTVGGSTPAAGQDRRSSNATIENFIARQTQLEQGAAEAGNAASPPFAFGVKPVPPHPLEKTSNYSGDDASESVGSSNEMYRPGEGPERSQETDHLGQYQVYASRSVSTVDSRFSMDISEDERYALGATDCPDRGKPSGTDLGTQSLLGLQTGTGPPLKAAARKKASFSSDEEEDKRIFTPMTPPKLAAKAWESGGQQQTPEQSPSQVDFLKVSVTKALTNRPARGLASSGFGPTRLSPSKAAGRKADSATSGARGHAERVHNIVRQVITSVQDLGDARISQESKRRLVDQGMKNPRRNRGSASPYAHLAGAGGTSVSNMSMITASPGRGNTQGASPSKPVQRELCRKRITVVRPMALADEIEQLQAKEVSLAGIKGVKNPILPAAEFEPKPRSNIAATLLTLKRNQAAAGRAQGERRASASGMMALIQSQIQASLINVQRVEKKEEARKFHKYEVQKAKDSQNLLKMKSPGTRKRELKEYEAGIEQEERNKVFHAIEFNQIQVVEAYIKSHMLGSDVTDQYGNTLLSAASQFGCYDICDLLIKEGANVNTQNNQGNTPLHYAIAYNMASICDLLVENGAHENIKNKKRLTPWQGI